MLALLGDDGFDGGGGAGREWRWIDYIEEGRNYCFRFHVRCLAGGRRRL